jgi:phosphoadenosine phosphosulfate reductase
MKEGEAPVTTAGTVDHEALIEELAQRAQAFEQATPGEILRWAVDRFGGDMVFACSFQDIVLLDLVSQVAPELEVVFLDTEGHFPETWAFVDAVTQRYDLNLVVTKPGPDAVDFPCGAEGCCTKRKVEPLKAAVAGKAAWITALKRCDAPTRASAPILSWDQAFGLVKINPMATWSDEDIASYERDHELLVHPLIAQGYLSIGCASTTRPVAPGEDPRAGRWSGSDKIECGLHEA